MSAPAPQSGFEVPPVLFNARGEVRKAGFEFEYAGLDITESARIVHEAFGGTIEARGTFEHRVIGTRLGDFTIEIDTSLLKERKYERPLRAMGFDPERHDTAWLENALLGTFATLVPIEVGAPPIPITELGALESLRLALHDRGAKGTRASVFYAFGLHINIEIPRDDVAVLRDYLRAFVLLYPWIKRRADVDLSRSISPFIDKFPREYRRLILQPDYPADARRLIEDYLAHNPTRNRALDMLPLLGWLDAQRVGARLERGTLVKPRPAFHYRLPNCEIDDPAWTLAREWNTWIEVERLARDPQRLAEMSRHYLDAEDESFKPFYDKWPGVLEQHMQQQGEQA
jgi:hypothetical protein